MLAKGHHFPNVSLVGILNADSGLYSNDFHAIERLGQVITQVAGRAGRSSKKGKVFIQTHNQDHPMLQTLINENYLSFLNKTLLERQEAILPPYSSHTLFISEADSLTKALNLLTKFKHVISQNMNDKTICLGPIPAINEKRSGRYRAHLLMQATSKSALQKTLSINMPVIEKLKFDYKTRWLIDVDPIDML